MSENVNCYSSLLFKYSPDQPRDDHGRFGEGSDDAIADSQADARMSRAVTSATAQAHAAIASAKPGDTGRAEQAVLRVEKLARMRELEAMGVMHPNYQANLAEYRQLRSDVSKLGRALRKTPK
jgi:hypothetical protein